MPRQILEESFTALQVKEEALSKKEEDVSALQRQTEALLNTLPPQGSNEMHDSSSPRANGQNESDLRWLHKKLSREKTKHCTTTQ